jgi:hypothetical protein
VPLHRIQKWLGHTNISQTSTYLMADAADDEQAMRDFEAQREALQKLATNSETPRRRRPRTATMRDNNPRLSSERSH